MAHESVVEGGEEAHVIAQDGVVVARLVPVVAAQSGTTSARQAALARTHARMDKGWPLGAGPVDRDELHRR